MGDNKANQEETEQKDYHDKSVQARMNRPTPEQQRTGGRGGGEEIDGQTPVDKEQGQGATNDSPDKR